MGDLLTGPQPPTTAAIKALLRRTSKTQPRTEPSEPPGGSRLSLYVRPDGMLTVSFPTLKNILDIHHSDRVLTTLEVIEHCFTVVTGTLETEARGVRTDKGEMIRLTAWKNTPTIRLDERYRAQERPGLVRDVCDEESICAGRDLVAA